MTLDSSSLACSNRMMSLLEEIYPHPRMINSPGLDKTFEIIKREIPDTIIHEYPSGMECEDWIVPSSWSVKEGFMKDSSGNTIASIEESHLFISPYSEPVDGWFTKEEITKHLTTRPDRPDAFALEHRNAYNYQLVDWGITMPYTRWSNLPEGKYHVRIETDCKPGSMKVGEYFLKGKKPETICICAHIDELCNDDLSGCVVAIELMRYIESLTERQYSYQMLLVPEMFGPMFFAYNNPEKIKHTIGMLNLEALGAGSRLFLKRALQTGSGIERVHREALKKEGITFGEMDFFEGYGNDERVYAWPQLNIPGVALQRFPFDEYHTSDDTPDIINSKYLMEAVEIGKKFVQILEQNYVPDFLYRLPPWLTRRGLYFDCRDDKEKFHKFNNIVMFNVNGRFSLLDLAEMSGLDFFKVYDYMEKFVDQGIVKKSEVKWDIASHES